MDMAVVVAQLSHFFDLYYKYARACHNPVMNDPLQRVIVHALVKKQFIE